MPLFQYTARTLKGDLVNDKIDLPTRDDVIGHVGKNRWVVVQVSAAPKEFKLNIKFGGGVKTRDVVVFTRQFATMINAGLPLVQALDILAQQTENKILADTTRQVVYDVESGQTLADALRKHPKAFSDLYVNMAAAGEGGGTPAPTLTRLLSRMPPASPAATMLTYRSLNALGCLRSASASVWPLSTSYTTCRVTSARILFSVCCARMSRAWTRGRPALIIVANWRVNTTTSRGFTPPPNLKLSFDSFGSARTCTTTLRFFRRCAITSSRVRRSILSLTKSPLSVRAVYWKTGIAHSLRGA